MGCFHRPFISCRAGWCCTSPPSTISRRWRSWALMTSSAEAPWWAKSQGPPSCWHVIVFIGLFLSWWWVWLGRPVGLPRRAGRLLGGGVEPVEQVGGRDPEDEPGHLL